MNKWYIAENIHFGDGLFRRFLESSETGIQIPVEQQRHFDRCIGGAE